MECITNAEHHLSNLSFSFVAAHYPLRGTEVQRNLFHLPQNIFKLRSLSMAVKLKQSHKRRACNILILLLPPFLVLVDFAFHSLSVHSGFPVTFS